MNYTIWLVVPEPNGARLTTDRNCYFILVHTNPYRVRIKQPTAFFGVLRALSAQSEKVVDLGHISDYEQLSFKCFPKMVKLTKKLKQTTTSR